MDPELYGRNPTAGQAPTRAESATRDVSSVLSYEIYADRALVHIRAGGRPSTQASVALMTRVSEDPRFEPGMSVLVDRRGFVEPPDAHYTSTMLDHLAASWPPDVVRRWAIVTKPGAHFGMARMLSLRAELRGITMEAFDNEQDALEWLGRRG